MLASRIVAQRVSYTTKVCAHQIKDVLVAHVCRAGAGMPQPSPIDDCMKYVEPGEDGPGRTRDANARVVRTVPTASAEPMQPAKISRRLPLRWRVRLQQACAQAALLGQAADEPANTQRQQRRVEQGPGPGCAAPHGAPNAPGLQERERACAWPPYRPRCSVASSRDWYGRRAPAHRADCPRLATLCGRRG